MIIKINLEDTIKEFEVDTMKELISQITEQLKDKDGNDLSEDDKQNASWMDAYLEKHKIIVNLRRSRGKDIDAACGQLANKNGLSN